MKKAIVLIFVLLLGVLTATLTCCDAIKQLFGTDGYSIVYTDDQGKHTIKVKDGETYSLKKIPERYGYDFIGLYDSEDFGESTSGVQFVDEKGKSLMPYTDQCDMTLYPWYTPKKCTVIFDIQDATDTVPFERSEQIFYDTVIENKHIASGDNLKLDHHSFAGWFTKPNCQGVQIADKDGNVLRTPKLNKELFNFTKDFEVTLYAGFEVDKQNVTIYYNNNADYKSILVPYGSDVSECGKLIELNDMTVTRWEKKENDQWSNFSGTITQDMTLRIADYAYCISFDVKGGQAVENILVKDGERITLPNTYKDYYRFSGWIDASGSKYGSYLTMPSHNITLYATYTPYKITFNSSGGSAVSDIEIKNAVTVLPVPQKQDYVFCGWYSGSSYYYDSFKNENRDVALTAKWTLAVIHNESSFWSKEIKTQEKNIDVANNSVNINIPSELSKAIALGKVGVKVTATVSCSVRSMGDATGRVTTTISINGKSIEGPQASVTGGGYNLIGTTAHSKWSDTIRKTINENFILKDSSPITFGVLYHLWSNRKNDKVYTTGCYLCDSLVVELYNV